MYVGLVFDRQQQQPFAIFLFSLRQRQRGRVRFGFEGQELSDVGGQLADLHATIELVSLGHERDDDFANFSTGRVELRQTGLLRSLLGLDQKLNDGVHVDLHQPADIPLHRGDIAIDRQCLEAVFLKLPKLDVEHG